MARILLIDDDELLRGVLSKTLGHAGHQVVEAGDGREGLAKLSVEIELVITDLMMPEQEGVETILQMRRDYPGLPVIAISGHSPHSELYLQMATKLGAQGVLAKPFTPQELLKLIATVLPPEGRPS